MGRKNGCIAYRWLVVGNHLLLSYSAVCRLQVGGTFETLWYNISTTSLPSYSTPAARRLAARYTYLPHTSTGLAHAVDW